MSAKTGLEILQNVKGNIGLEGPHPANLEYFKKAKNSRGFHVIKKG